MKVRGSEQPAMDPQPVADASFQPIDDAVVRAALPRQALDADAHGDSAALCADQRVGQPFVAKIIDHPVNRSARRDFIHALLELRRSNPELFARGEYTPCEVIGPGAEHVCAFVRRHERSYLIVAVSRLLYTASRGDFAEAIDPTLWKGTWIKAPMIETPKLTDVLTGHIG